MLLEDVNKADPKVLRLFPSMDFRRGTLMPQVEGGLKTDLRILIVAADNGYVNHQILTRDYAVGGDSRTRSLSRLHELRLLSRYRTTSKKKVRKDVYRLSGKGLLLCAAFPRIFKSETYVSLMKKCVPNRSLANTILLLYGQPAGDCGNRLLEALHWAADRGFNLENLPEEALSERLLSTEELTENNLLSKLLRWFLDALSRMTDEDVESMLRDVSEFVRTAHSKPLGAKFVLVLQEEIDRLLRSSDFLVWLKARRALGVPITHFFQIFRESYPRGLGYVEDHDEAFWDDTIRNRVFPEIRRRIREEALSMTSKVETSALEGLG
jgi:hypothetical protein